MSFKILDYLFSRSAKRALATLLWCGVLLFFTGCLARTALNIPMAYGAVVDERTTEELLSDKNIEYTIIGKLTAKKASNLLDITVDSFRGHVYLVGEYRTPKQQEEAIEITRTSEGVRFVTTYLRPMLDDPDCSTENNIAIVASVKKRLIRDRNIWGTDVDVHSVQCTVVMVGLVKTKEQIREAIRIAENVEGVRSVKSLLKATQN